MTQLAYHLTTAAWIAGLVLVGGTASAQLSAGVGASAGTEAKADGSGTAAADYDADADANAGADANENAGAQAEAKAPPPPPPPAAPAAEVADPPPAAAESDHEGVVGHFAVGFLGRRGMLVPAEIAVVGAPPALVEEQAPIIGVRYWIDSMLGIDAGIGLLLSSGSYDPEVGDEVDSSGATIFMLHGGVPLALISTGHFSFQVVPELNFGLASRTVSSVDPEVEHSATHFDIGARVGAEVQFGFIDIPQLSLQAGVGLLYAMDSVSVEQDGNEDSLSSGTLRTDAGGNPWNIFTSNISALYYF